MSYLTHQEKYGFDAKTWFYNILTRMKKLPMNIITEQQNIDGLINIYYCNYQEFINQICDRYSFSQQDKETFLKSVKWCYICSNNYPYNKFLVVGYE